MNTKAIETISISAVRDSIVVSDYLDQYIADNDKEPSWDGFVYIYNAKNKKKNQLTGRVPVQVKGTVNNDLSKSEISYPVNIIDMKNYLNDGGVVYFVVYINENGNRTKIYYQTLTPVKLKLYLGEIERSNIDSNRIQKTKNLKLIEFPNDSLRKANIFLNFFNDGKKQISFSKSNVFSFDDLSKLDKLTELSLTVSGYGYGVTRNEIHRAILENEVYVYAMLKGSDILLPIDELPIDPIIKEVETAVISINEKKYYNQFLRIKSLENTLIQIGDSLFIEVNENLGIVKFRYKPASMLRKRTKDLEFFVDLITRKSFFVDGIRIPFDLNDDEIRKINIKEQKESLEYYFKMILALDTLHVKEDINLEEMTDQEYRQFYNLVIAFADRKPVSNLKPNLPRIGYVSIANITLLLIFEKYLDSYHTFIIQDYFSSGITLGYETIDGEKLKTSEYSILQKEGYLKVSNINYDAILPSYQSLKNENEEIFEKATNDLLMMLLAYDESSIKNSRLLNAAKKLAKWILDDDDKKHSYELNLLNYLQVVRRERKFNSGEHKQLYTVAGDASKGDDIITGALLLLENRSEAEKSFLKMDEELQKSFIKYPIYKFWNQVDN
ncbi:DUF4365 domain-containing protein [Paenibacillus yanchengensis]|uniref:DUF4365 domain-containing protein n=1 Tax=Paenibacillus yanchengensis TaxID=2035833 RepID=A0ABW4YFS7_9BACL